MNIEVTGAIVLTGRGADKVSLSTTLPAPLHLSNSEDDKLELDFQVARGCGKGYVMRTLGVPEHMIEVIDSSGLTDDVEGKSHE